MQNRNRLTGSAGVFAAACMLALVSLVPCSLAQAPTNSTEQEPITSSLYHVKEAPAQIYISGKHFGHHQDKSIIKLDGVEVDPKIWSDEIIVVVIPGPAPLHPVDVKLIIDKASVPGNDEWVRDENLGTFTPQAAGQSVSDSQPLKKPVSKEAIAPHLADQTAITQGEPATPRTSASLAPPAPSALPASPAPQTAICSALLAKPSITSITPTEGVAGTKVTINGSGFRSKQGESKVTLTKQPPANLNNPSPNNANRTKQEKTATVATNGWSDSQIVVTAPDFNADNDLPLTVSVYVADPKTDKTTSTEDSITFKETTPQWGDKDEKPLDIKFVGGYEQGFQSAQSSSSDAFLAIYGRALFFTDTFGPFYHIRLQTAPQASNTYGVVSLLSNPSGAVTTQSLQTVGSAVDLSLGLEYQIPHRTHSGQRTLGLIAGGGFVTPLQVNSVSASYVMPAFGTVECTALQSRLSSALSNPIYAGIKANTASTSTSCYSNTTTSTPTAVSTLVYAAPGQPNFFPKYFAGLSIVNRFAGATGLKVCDESNPCERGYVDFTLGQNASVSGGTLKHLVAGVDSIYPLPVPSLNFIYLFGSTSVRLHNLPPGQSPLILTASPTSGSSTPPASPNPAVLVLPLTQPDRDFYRIGAGINLNDIFKSLKPKSATNP